MVQGWVGSGLRRPYKFMRIMHNILHSFSAGPPNSRRFRTRLLREDMQIAHIIV